MGAKMVSRGSSFRISEIPIENIQYLPLGGDFWEKIATF
jgi:hypothetical protein